MAQYNQLKSPFKNQSNNIVKYIAFLRGVNVGGHKVPMAELKSVLEKIGLREVVTLLNSGNVIFQSDQKQTKKLELQISTELEKHFGFPIPVFVRKGKDIQDWLKNEPFKNVEVDEDTRLYISFLQKPMEKLPIQLPYVSEDGCFKIIESSSKEIFSVLNLGESRTIEAMAVLEKYFGKNISTRNWNTISRIGKKL